MSTYISNAFSLSMLPRDGVLQITRYPLSGPAHARATLYEEGPWRSVVGHQATAELFTRILGIGVEYNRETLVLRPGDRLIVGQYYGPRLSEGATELPLGATIEWVELVAEDVE